MRFMGYDATLRYANSAWYPTGFCRVPADLQGHPVRRMSAAPLPHARCRPHMRPFRSLTGSRPGCASCGTVVRRRGPGPAGRRLEGRSARRFGPRKNLARAIRMGCVSPRLIRGPGTCPCLEIEAERLGRCLSPAHERRQVSLLSKVKRAIIATPMGASLRTWYWAARDLREPGSLARFTAKLRPGSDRGSDQAKNARYDRETVEVLGRILSLDSNCIDVGAQRERFSNSLSNWLRAASTSRLTPPMQAARLRDISRA